MKVSSPVAAEVHGRFPEEEAGRVLSAFDAAELPFLEDASRAGDLRL